MSEGSDTFHYTEYAVNHKNRDKFYGFGADDKIILDLEDIHTFEELMATGASASWGSSTLLGGALYFGSVSLDALTANQFEFI
jgi:hypothetical protein